MKSLFIDTNLINKNGSIQINDMLVKNLDLQVGEKIIVYQDADSWQAEVVYDKNCWSVMIISEAQAIKEEHKQGHEEGFGQDIIHKV